MSAGAAAMLAKIEKLRRTMPNQITAAVYAEANIELTEAKKRTPVAPAGTTGAGNLRASGHVTDPEITDDSITCSIIFGGGPSAAYAIAVHEHESEYSPRSWVGNEDIDWNVPGTGPKFLESVLMESRAYMGQRIAKRINVKL